MAALPGPCQSVLDRLMLIYSIRGRGRLPFYFPLAMLALSITVDHARYRPFCRLPRSHGAALRSRQDRDPADRMAGVRRRYRGDPDAEAPARRGHPRA